MENTISSYKCPNCGADIPYDPNSSNLKCKYCGTEYEVEILNQYSEAIKHQEDSYDWDEYNGQELEYNRAEYVCPSCGGSVIMDEDSSASYCPYCGSTIILNDKVSGMLKPDLVVPFKVSKEAAKSALKKELSNKILLPSDFAKQEYLDKIEGIYIPYWLYDCNADCHARFRMTRTNSWRSGDYRYTKTSYFMGIRDGKMEFEKVPVDASLKLDSELLESLEPFDYAEAVDFNTAYLAGFYADIRQEDENACKSKANNRIHQSMLDALSSSVVGYSSCIVESSSISFNNGKAHYALLPVYLISKKYKDRVYTFAINGQTSKVSGEIPSDYKKLVLYSLCLLLFSFAIIFIVAYFLLGPRL